MQNLTFRDIYKSINWFTKNMFTLVFSHSSSMYNNRVGYTTKWLTPWFVGGNYVTFKAMRNSHDL
jgi:hypothetical protein